MGVPRSIRHDNGSEFKNKLFVNFLQKNNIEDTTGIVGYP
jgi:hypothetical protein